MSEQMYDVDVTVRVYAESPEEAKQNIFPFLVAAYEQEVAEGFDFYGEEEE
jgi:hypothetical protein